jgi:hypothetical protein
VNKGLSLLPRLVLQSPRALLQDKTAWCLIHLQPLLLRLLSPIQRLALAFQGFAIHGQLNVPRAWLCRSSARFLPAPADLAS